MTTRRTFLKNSLALAALAKLDLPVRKRKLPLAFSTLGCPDWTLAQILETAVSQGYQAVEIRGLGQQLALPQCPEFSTPERITQTRRQFADRNLKICNLGASAALHHLDAAQRQKNLDEARQYIDLAHALGCPYIRVFPNDLPKDQDRKQTLELISGGLRELGEYAQKAQVTVLLESHGEVIWKDVLLQILSQAEHPNAGLIWDIFNMWSITKEPPTEVYQTLKKYIRHTHIKDGRMVDGKPVYTFLGEGETPLREAFDALKAGGYQGYYSWEWEKRWHPELADPKLAFAHYPKAIQAYF